MTDTHADTLVHCSVHSKDTLELNLTIEDTDLTDIYEPGIQLPHNNTLFSFVHGLFLNI